jgi:glycerol-3-phosphate dehydrogenase
VLRRRLHLTTETRDEGAAAIDVVALLLARELGWSEDTRASETARARAALVDGSRWRELS